MQRDEHTRTRACAKPVFDPSHRACLSIYRARRRNARLGVTPGEHQTTRLNANFDEPQLYQNGSN
jgi:hypothetical protein